MIQKFVDRFNAKRDELRSGFAAGHPEEYKDIVKRVLEAVSEDYNEPDPEKIHTIDDGNYQGCLLFLSPSRGYQPSTYFYVFVYYGSCSGCDTLQAIRDYRDDPPDDQQVNDYMKLALEVVQGIKKISPYGYED